MSRKDLLDVEMGANALLHILDEVQHVLRPVLAGPNALDCPGFFWVAPELQRLLAMAQSRPTRVDRLDQDLLCTAVRLRVTSTRSRCCSMRSKSSTTAAFFVRIRTGQPSWERTGSRQRLPEVMLLGFWSPRIGEGAEPVHFGKLSVPLS